MIKRKAAICKSCGNERQIYAKMLCCYCYERQRKKTPLPRPKKQIAKFSKKHLSRLREYRKAMEEYMKEKPICEYPGCNMPATDLHHGAGRCGSLLFDKRYFKALCRQHHIEVELSPNLAKKLGLSFSRLTKD